MATNLQFLLIALCGIALFLLVKILFASTNNDSSPSYEELQKQDQRFTTRFPTWKAVAETKSTAPLSDDLGRVRVTQFNFAHFDAVAGPPDPESFADELIVELYDSVSDFRWTSTYVVATPTGIRKMMDEERWSFFHATELFIVRRYDLQMIREAVLGRIKEIHNEAPLDPEEPPIRG